jgi:FkbM family methyltransferase
MSLPTAKLRPAKIRTALRRRVFEALMERTPLRSGPTVVVLGRKYGGYAIPDGVVEPSWICYSVGAGGDVSFDLELIGRYGATVRAFDPVPSYVELAHAEAGDEPRFSIHQAALATADGPLRMQITHDAGSRSVSAAELYDTREFLELPGRTLRSLMAELDDERVDFLKMDIEGAEYALLGDLDLRAIGVKLLAVQLHHTGTVRQARTLIRRLEGQGYVPVGRHPAVKLTFVARELLAPNGRQPRASTSS